MNPYETLGIQSDATDDDIKKAYRRKAVETHPDKQGGANEAFLAVQRAYETLSDPQARARYDETGAMSDEPTLFERCMAELQKMAVMLIGEIQDPQSLDMVHLMRQNCDKCIVYEKSQSAALRRQADKFLAAAGRFKDGGAYPDSAVNPISAALTGQAKQMELLIQKCDRKVEAAEMCLTILKDFRYEAVSQPVSNQQAVWNGLKTYYT